MNLSSYEKELIEAGAERLLHLQSLKENTTSLNDSIPFLTHYRGSVNLTFRIYDKDKTLVMNNTTVFAHVKEDEFNPDLYAIESGGTLQFFISKTSGDNYILTGIDQNSMHLVYTYQL